MTVCHIAQAPQPPGAGVLTSGQAGGSAEVTALDLPVSGDLPVELDGCFARIGPSRLRPAERTMHLFAGEGMVHGVRLRNGHAEWYRNRWIRGERVCRALGEPSLPGPRHGLSDNANASLIQHAGRILALGESGVLPIELDADLRSVASTDFDATLPNGFTAHPQRDPVTGELFAIAYYHELPYVQYLVIDVAGRVRRAEPITVKSTPMMHALSLTERYVILYDLSVTFSPRAAASGERFPYRWDRGHGARLGILPREGTDADVAWLEIEPCYVFHPLNAYESGDRIVLDVVRHERVFDTDPLRPGESAPTLWRWTIDGTRCAVQAEQLDDAIEEFPRIDDRRNGLPNRYGYAVVMDGAGGCAGSAVVKHDLARARSERHEFGAGRRAGECVFVPRIAAKAEDDGWLLTFVYDQASGQSALAVLDAADITACPEAVVHLPVAVPDGFHAAWIPSC
jgi:carotenoid cleavage dioxygenase-like enzyme